MRWQDRIPLSWRRHIQMRRLQFRDRMNGLHRQFAPADEGDLSWPVRLDLSQPVKRSHLYENKLHNIRSASLRIQQYRLDPSRIFSFWRAVGYPGPRQGYKLGRNLVGGKLQEDIGGGLCQLSGLMYHLSLLAGLEILERHPHSKDIYSEAERYTPLGADATVAYGYKDLRLRNPYDFPLRFEVQVDADKITCNLRGPSALQKHEITFQRRPHPEGEEVHTYRVGASQPMLLARSVYRK